MQSKGWALTLMWRLLHPRRVGDFVKPCHTQGCRGTPSPKLHACTASTSLIAWGSPGWTPQPCCRVWGALGCHHTVPVQTDPSPWKRLSLGKSENGQTWELLG